MIGVLQGVKELALHLFDPLDIKTGGGPGWRDIEQIPAQGIGTVFFKHFKRIDGIALGFGHFLAFGIQDQVIDQDLFVRRFAGDKG